MKTALGRADRIEAHLDGLTSIGQNARFAREDTFDLLARNAVLSAFGPVSIVPLEAGYLHHILDAIRLYISEQALYLRASVGGEGRGAVLAVADQFG